MTAQQLSLDTLPHNLHLAAAWRDANPAAWAAIVDWARQDAAHGVRPAIDLYVNLLRRPHFARKLGLVRMDAAYSVNNNLRSELARLVMREYPELKFEIRHASVDEPGVPNSVVMPRIA